MFSVRTLPRLLSLLFCLLVLLGGVRSAFSQSAPPMIWDQPGDSQAGWGPSQISRNPIYEGEWGITAELADDFDMVGSISEIAVAGYNGHIGGSNNPPPFYGVTVRFYAAGQDGKPGELLAEYWRAAGDPGLETDFVVPSRFRVKLAPAFNGTGRTFVSLQVAMDPEWQAKWYWGSSGTNKPRGEGAWFRNLRAENPGWTRNMGYASMNCDLVFSLFGSREPVAPVVESLSAASATRSGRLRIFGGEFGFSQGDGSVRIGGIVAPISRWTDRAITCYVPETAPLRSVDVQVTTAGGASQVLPVEVTARPAAGRVQWRFQADSPYFQGRPAVAPDGTTYAGDIRGHLYAIGRDGGLKWLRNLEPASVSQSIALGRDGTVYVGAVNTLIALDPNDGAEKWRVADPSRSELFAGPSVGPDGNIYAATNDFAAGGQGIGIFAVSPEGRLVWSRPGLVAKGEIWGPQEIPFGPNGQLYVSTQTELFCFRLDGTLLWKNGASGQPAVAPDGTVYARSTGVTGGVQGNLAAYAPDGSLLRTFSRGSTAPDVGPEGTVYVTESDTLAAYGPEGARRWTWSEPFMLFAPIASPLNTLVVAAGQTNFGQPCYLQGVSVGGQPLWRLTLPMENDAAVYPFTRPTFSPDGRSVLVGMAGNDYAPDPACWLYSVDTGLEPGQELPFLAVAPSSVVGGVTATGALTLKGRAPAEGTVISLSSSDPAASVPATVTVPGGLQGIPFPVTTRPVAARTEVTVTAFSGGQTHTAVLVVLPPAPARVEIDPWLASPGETVTGTVTLNGAAPPGGQVLALSSSDPGTTVPATVTVPAGETSATFPIEVVVGPVGGDLVITATANGISQSETLWVDGLYLDSVEITPMQATGGEALQGRVTLSGNAPPGGIVVSLFSDDETLLRVPATVLIPQGQRSTTFEVQTTAVVEWTSVDLWALLGFEPGDDEEGDWWDDELGTWVDLQPANADDVVIEAAQFSGGATQAAAAAKKKAPKPKKQLTIRANTNAGTATLTVYDWKTKKAIGKLKRSGKKGPYTGTFQLPKKPERISVRSSRGGGATKEVTDK
jgi:hypothetical protein